jgi:hypothetical protein
MLLLHPSVLNLGSAHARLLRRQTRPICVMPELLILQLRLLSHNRVRLPHRLYLKQPAHLLELDPFRLGHEEEDEDDAENHERREEEVHAVLHLQEHLGREAADDEVPEPVVGGGRRLAQRPRVLVEHLAVDDPGGAVPRGRVEGGPEVEEEDGGGAAGRQGSPGRAGAGDLDVGAEEPHADGATGGKLA